MVSMAMDVSVIVIMVMAMLMRGIMVCSRNTDREPQADRPQCDQRQQGDPAPQHVDVQVVGEDEGQDTLDIQHDGHASEQAANSDRAKLFHVIGGAFFAVRMSHDGSALKDTSPI